MFCIFSFPSESVVVYFHIAKKTKALHRRIQPRYKAFCSSGRQDLNLRPLAPHASALPDCATPRRYVFLQSIFTYTKCGSGISNSGRRGFLNNVLALSANSPVNLSESESKFNHGPTLYLAVFGLRPTPSRITE